MLQLTLLAAYLHAFMEWLFFVTKSSSLSILTLFEKLKVLFITGGVTALLLAGGFIILSLPFWLTKNQKLIFLGYIHS